MLAVCQFNTLAHKFAKCDRFSNFFHQLLEISPSIPQTNRQQTCGGIFNDQFVTQSLPSPKVKEFENWSTFAKVQGKNSIVFLLLMGYYHHCWYLYGFDFVYRIHGLDQIFKIAQLRASGDQIFIPTHRHSVWLWATKFGMITHVNVNTFL